MTLVIGLTGGIATGKSTVTKMMKRLGVPVIDADQIARQVVEPGRSAYQAVIKQFGEDILLDNGQINRPKLGSIVFADKEKREQLNQIVHPAVRQEMLQLRDQYIERGVKSVVLDIPLLFESKLTNMVDKVIVVYVPKQLQLKRLINRDQFTEPEALQRINAQLPTIEKAKQADAVIDNRYTKENTFLQLKYILQQWQAI